MVHNHIFQFHDAKIIRQARPWVVDVFYPNVTCLAGYVRQSFKNYLNQTSVGCVQTSINLGSCGGYSTSSIPFGTPFIYMLYEDGNVFNDLNNYDGCNPGNISNTTNQTYDIPQDNNYMDKYNSSLLDFTCSVFAKALAVTQSTRSVSQVLQSLALFIDDF